MPRRFTREGVAALVDHTLLKPEATEHDVVALVSEAAELEVFAVCVSPSMVPIAKSFRSADLQIASVVGFPSGKHVSAIKAEEARLAVAAGADEIDMVIDIGAALSGDFDAVRADIAAVVEAIPDYVVLKVIVESAALLSLGGGPLLVDVCRIAEEAGRRFREDLHRISPVRRRVGAGGRVDGRRRSATGSASRPAAASAPPTTPSRCCAPGRRGSGCRAPARCSTGWTYRDPRSPSLLTP